jgi:hypothetical protein
LLIVARPRSIGHRLKKRVHGRSSSAISVDALEAGVALRTYEKDRRMREKRANGSRHKYEQPPFD